MKSKHVIFIALLTIAIAARGQDPALEGCTSPTRVAEVLQKVDRLRGKDLTLDGIKNAWPDSLEGFGCTPEGCTSMLHEGRIIDNLRECAEEFAVVTETGNVNDRMLDVVITYSAHHKSTLIRAAQTISRAVGAQVPELSNTTVMKTEVEWKNKQTNDRYLLKIGIEPKGSIMVMHLHLFRYSEEPGV